MLHVRKMIFAVLAVLVAVLALPLSANAVSARSGHLSSGLEWSLDTNGVLAVKGNGKIPDDERPWAEFYETDGIKSIVIGSGVTEIGKGAFAGCSAKTVSLPDTVTRLNEECFAKCFELESITVPKGVKVIERAAYGKCYGIKEVILNEGLEEIAGGAFQFNKIEKIVIPQSVKRLGGLQYNPIKEIHIPKGVTEIEQGVLSGCVQLESITVDAENPSFKAVGNCLIETETGLLLAACDNSVIPSDGSVRAIGEYVFNEHADLQHIDLPDSIETIGQCAFRYCNGLKNVVLPKRLKTIGIAAFYGCENLRDITVPKSVMFIDEHGISPVGKNPLTVHGYSGSYAETFAKENGIAFAALPEGSPDTGEKALSVTASAVLFGLSLVVLAMLGALKMTIERG